MIYAITGLPRTGTSLMAEVIHNLGIPAAETIYPPFPPTWRAEWEETGLVRLIFPGNTPTVNDLDEFLKHRWLLAERIFKVPHFAIKSCFLLLHRGALEEAASDLGFQVSWVLMEREEEARLKSQSFYPWLTEELLSPVREAIPDRMPDNFTPVQYEELIAHPRSVIEGLCERFGISKDRLDEAVKIVQGPTDYGSTAFKAH